MSFFSTILEKIGIKKKEEPVAKPAEAAKPVAAPQQPKPAPAAQPAQPAAPTHIPGTAAAAYMSSAAKPAASPASAEPAEPKEPAKPVAIDVVDVVSNLEKLAASRPEKLDWKVSIVDLLKLLDIDSSLKARQELAKELGCPPDTMSDSARMNVWLHKTVLQKIAENGGNIPQELLD